MAKQVGSQRSTEAPASAQRKRTRSKAPPADVAAPSEATPQAAAAHEPTHAEIAERAYGLYLARGAHEGDAFDDWVRAENELRTTH